MTAAESPASASRGRTGGLLIEEGGAASAAIRAADGVPGFGADPAATLHWCVDVGRTLPPVGDQTAIAWEALAATAYRDVAAARTLEPHLDALTILRQAGLDPFDRDAATVLAEIGAGAESTWGVFAAEGPGMRLDARRTGERWELTGTKAWCSLAAVLSHALVTAFVGDERRLFAVDLRAPEVRPHEGPWVARGLAGIVSAPVDFAGAAAVPVGEAGWYLRRPGFAWGGMSVAACWWGGALAVKDALEQAAAAERADQAALLHLGRADAALWAARAALREAADLVDRRAAVDAKLLAARVRAVVADAVTTTLHNADDALGPGPLVADDPYARRIADLHLYLRQYHGLRDAARLGSLVVGSRRPR